ncbi:MAG TPA: efflux RND transporter periplasmic adaptor subunit [Nitrospiria bacterium]|nr:efflux RND transporter periplasmic adaptor subunit [Nitrospiria bacterium]
MKRVRMMLIALVVVGAATAAWWYAAVESRNGGVIRLSGNIEATETDVSFKIRGTIVQRPVDEGMWVEKGALIAKLEDHDLVQSVELADASLKVAQSKLNELLAGSRPQEIKASLEQLNQAESDLELSRREYERVKALYEQQLAPASSMDNVETAYHVAQAAATRARQLYDLVKEGPRKEEIASARASVDQARQNLDLAKIQLTYATLIAPTSGIVLTKSAEVGEVVSAGTPVVTLGDLDHVWLRAYVNETDLGRIAWGQDVDVTTDTFPGKRYHGTIGFISSEAEFTPKSVQTEKERVTLVYRIKVYLDNPNRELKPGMPADGIIHVKPAAVAR